jgi:hypothetical protein
MPRSSHHLQPERYALEPLMSGSRLLGAHNLTFVAWAEEGALPFVQHLDVRVADQFEPNGWDLVVTRPRFLCVPSTKVDWAFLP